MNFQTIEGHTVVVIEIPEEKWPWVVATGDTMLEKVYASFVNHAVITGIIRGPGKYGIEDTGNGDYKVWAINEPTS